MSSFCYKDLTDMSWARWRRTATCCAALALVALAPLAHSQAAAPASPLTSLDTVLSWRSIGPARGGRSIAVAGSTARPLEAYFGATGGGLWKSNDAGTTWRPVTDGFLHSSSVGAVAVAPSNPDIVYIGMGEGELRANVLQGDGVYRSSDAGETWEHIGLANSKTIAALRVHPSDPDTLYAAALGDPYQENSERGVFKTTDGGRHWERVLYRSANTGAIDIAMDPHDPQRLFATLWQVNRTPWTLSSGGDESGFFRSMDGGNTWTEITGFEGLPAGPLGKMTVAVSGADPQRVYANIEAEAGGLYRSDDGGDSWERINGAKKLWQRSFYFMRVRADPKDRDKVFVLSFKLEKSMDGGQTFTAVPTGHADIHDLWIDPNDTQRMIVADDGGGSVSQNGGTSWSKQDFPTAQIYRVTTTGDTPYHVCGAQQDNTAVCVPSRPTTGVAAIEARREGKSEHYSVGYSEMGYVAPHPQKNDVFFVGATNSLTRYDRARNHLRNVHPYPYMVMGQSASSMTERWNWSFPIVFSPLEPHALYAGSQHLWQSTDEGGNWERISPDLTRADPATLGDSGGPINFDQDGPEVYGTLYTIAPSHFDERVIWTGSDDGLIQLTRNSGKTWQNVTPPDVSANSRISYIDASRHRQGTAYVAVKRNEMGDRHPYVYKTLDFGNSWSLINAGIPTGDFVHTIREDTEQVGLLYLGTEKGVHVSFDDGESWRSLSLNLPVTPVLGLEVKGDELVAATHGRSFYVLDDLSVLRQSMQMRDSDADVLYEPEPAVRGLQKAEFFLWLHGETKAASLLVLDEDQRPVRAIPMPDVLERGLQRFSWDLHYEGATVFPGMILESPSPSLGPMATPGSYTVRFSAGAHEQLVNLEVLADPRLKGEVSPKDLQRQTALALRARDASDTANKTVLAIRSIYKRVPADTPRQQELLALLQNVEATLYQVKNRSPKDKIAYPIQLNDRLAGIQAALTYGAGPPTRAQQRVLGQLEEELERVMTQYTALLNGFADVLEDAPAQHTSTTN